MGLHVPRLLSTIALLAFCAGCGPAREDVPPSNEPEISFIRLSPSVTRQATLAEAARHLAIRGPEVEPHVTAFAHALCARTGACTISTYEAHRPDSALALDILVSDRYGFAPSDDDRLTDTVVAFVERYSDYYGVEYQISRQELRTYTSKNWRPMEDRGGITENHFDHVHVGFRPWSTLQDASPASAARRTPPPSPTST